MIHRHLYGETFTTSKFVPRCSKDRSMRWQRLRIFLPGPPVVNAPGDGSVQSMVFNRGRQLFSPV